MKKEKTTLRMALLALFFLSATQLAMATPCIWRKKQSDNGQKEAIKIPFQAWMFDYAEWETNELIYLQSWMYVIPPLYEINDYDIQDWMWDISQGWVMEEKGALTANDASV